ncbi:MAG: hypothetical protein ACYTKD_25750 [Planctomycetota bacterium]|jgi:hypothetical protein
MKIERADVLMVSACALAGFLFVSLATPGLITGLIAGIPSGAGGGCVACIVKRLLKSKPREQI